MHDPVPVPLEAGPLVVRRLGLGAVPGADGPGGAGPQVLASRCSRSSRSTTGPGPGRRVRTRRGPGPGRRCRWPAMVSAQAAVRGLTGSATRDAQLGADQVEVAAGGVVQPALAAARPSAAGRPGGRGAGRARTAGTGTSGSSSASSVSSSARLEIMASRRRSSPPTGKPLKYQAMCLRRSAQPLALVGQADEQLGVPADRRRPPRPGSAARGSTGRRTRRPGRGTARAGPGSRGRSPRRPPRSRPPSAARPRPPRCRRCRAPGWTRAAFRAAMAVQSASPE